VRCPRIWTRKPNSELSKLALARHFHLRLCDMQMRSLWLSLYPLSEQETAFPGFFSGRRRERGGLFEIPASLSPRSSQVPCSIPLIYNAAAEMYSLRRGVRRARAGHFHKTLCLRVNTLISVVFWNNNNFSSFPLQQAPSGPPITPSSQGGASVTLAAHEPAAEPRRGVRKTSR